MWAFQLIGKAASNTLNNFNVFAYNQSKRWNGNDQNLAGGGVVNLSGGPKALTEGNSNIYTMSWTADSTVGILDKWFGTGGLGLHKNTLKYWSMDNEPEIPKTETFTSHAVNALKSGTVSVSDSTFSAILPPISVTAVFMRKNVKPLSIKPQNEFFIVIVILKHNCS